MKDSEKIFSTILASTVHDIKNSLGIILNSLEILLKDIPKEKLGSQYGMVQYESSRVNSSLMQLLALYKLENDQLPFNPGYHNLFDFVEEQVLIHSPLLDAKNFTCQIDIDETIEAVFDETLVSMAISNIIGNAIRYAHSRLLISVEIDQQIIISICDDGPGYPGPMLEFVGNYILGINQSSGSTGLGLFFAQTVAELHHHADRVGKIQLMNGGALGGGIFKFSLP